jgi:hypothetical protein
MIPHALDEIRTGDLVSVYRGINEHWCRDRISTITAYGSAIATSVIDPHTMPHKHNAARRHRVCKMKFKVTNWRVYEAGLRRRGPLHVLVDSTGLKIYGAGQWLEEKHGAKSRHGWRKLHLALDADCRQHGFVANFAGFATYMVVP